MHSPQSLFLREPEIDRLDQLFDRGLFEAEEGRMILEQVLASWTDIQAISNLLLYPAVLPTDLVFPFLQKGLEAPPHLYVSLAAIVGIGKLPGSVFSPSEQEFLKIKLFHACQHSHPIISGRASYSLIGYCGEAELFGICYLLPHADPTTNHNLLYILYRLVSPASYEAFLLFLQEKIIPQDKLKAPLAMIQQAIQNRMHDPAHDAAAPLLQFIPDYASFRSS